MNWKQRLRIEYYELLAKRSKLTTYLKTRPELDEQDLLLLTRQQGIMWDYLNILFDRLRRAGWMTSLRLPWMKGNHECDWTEDFEHENGNYHHKCLTCGCDFIGHKRRMECRKCPEPSQNNA